MQNPDTPPISFTLPQLLHATKRKLQLMVLGEWVASTINQSEVDSLERDASEVLRLVQSIKNSLAPVARIPPEVLSLIPGYFCEDDVDRGLITLTHVSRRWRDTFICCSSLWNRLDFTNVDMTRTYIQRSRSSPLKLFLGDGDDIQDAFSLIIPHIHRLQSLTIDSDTLPSVLQNLRCHTPLLEKLDIEISPMTWPPLDDALFNGNLPSLRELRLYGVNPHIPWKNLANLAVVTLDIGTKECGTTQMLDFFESAPLLHTVRLRYTAPDSSDAPPERMVPLRHLKTFAIETLSPPPTLLHHLDIPTGASLTSEFFLREGDEPLFPDNLLKRPPNFNNLSEFTALNLNFDPGKTFVRFSGPSGSLRLLANWLNPINNAAESQLFHSLDFSTTRSLTMYNFGSSIPTSADDRRAFEAFPSMNHLRTLVLILCYYLPVTRVLDPEEHPSNLAPCPNLKELVFYGASWENFELGRVVSMARNRASSGVKLSSITFVDLDGDWERNRAEEEELEQHVLHVEYRFGDDRPPWDDVPADGNGGGENERFGK